jgi:DNA replication protein DnaC
MLLALLLKEMIREHGVRGYFTTFADLINLVSSGWYDKSERALYKRKVERASVLLIDDVGKEYEGAKFAKTELDNLLRTRVQNARPTLISMNMTLDEFEETYGMAVMSLMRERSVLIKLLGEDFRNQMNARVMRELAEGVRRPIV